MEDYLPDLLKLGKEGSLPNTLRFLQFDFNFNWTFDTKKKLIDFKRVMTLLQKLLETNRSTLDILRLNIISKANNCGEIISNLGGGE